MRNTIQFLVLGFICIFPSAVNSTLINRGNSLYDTETGFEWLDVPLTVNLSYNDIIGGAGGWLSQGYYPARINQVETLITSAGLQYENIEYHIPPAYDLVSRLGITYDQESNSFLMTEAFYTDSIFPLSPFGIDWVKFIFFPTPAEWDHPRIKYILNDANYGSDVKVHDTGWLMVRYNPVPIPGAFWLFGSGMIGLVFKKKTGGKGRLLDALNKLTNVLRPCEGQVFEIFRSPLADSGPASILHQPGP